MYDEVELKDREIIEIPPHKNQSGGGLPQSFGVALDNEEAQTFIDKDYRVFGDEEGPYLVIRVPFGQIRPLPARANVTFNPIVWTLRDDRSGVICWLKKVS